MSEEKKIIIDEDWKSQVAAEKEALAHESEKKPESGEAGQTAAMPPATFEMLLTTFATEAMVALGQFPNPVTRETTYRPEHARYAIDMLEMLEGKTQGNLSDDEAKMLTDLLHQLRMLFVSVQSAPPTGSEKKS